MVYLWLILINKNDLASFKFADAFDDDSDVHDVSGTWDQSQINPLFKTRYSEQITNVKTYKEYISTHNSRFCMEVGHQLLVQKSELGQGFRDFRPC